MSGLRKFFWIAVLLGCWGAAVPANTSLVRVFAGCAGRFSAEMEHAWLMGSPEAEALEARRVRFLSLLNATLPKNAARRMLSYRAEVKLAHASLLTLATFGENAIFSTQAARLAKNYVTTCENLLLDS